VWISGALNIGTGSFNWVTAERKNDELFMKLLDRLGRIYRCHRESHLPVDNDASHTSKRTQRYLEDRRRRIRLHPLPTWSPESNPVEQIWWGLHEAVSRNHSCEELGDLVRIAEGYLQERQPFRLDWGRSTINWKGRHHEIDKRPFTSWNYLDRRLTHRPHIVANTIEQIRKEANRGEEQF
jgi:transposase